ncbi:MAG: DUF2283 domain-containing protein [archaeon]|nr:DUF2283 domain-containing protein [archaeon]
MNAQFKYDYEANYLLIHKNKPAKSSIELGEIIIDIDKYNQVTAVEIMNPDKLWGIPKKHLKNIAEAKIRTEYRQGLFWIFLRLKIGEEIRPISIPLSMEQSALAACA